MILKNVKVLCDKSGISVRRLEHEVGLSNGSISKWDKSSPSVDKAMLVAKYFGVTLDHLVNQHDA